MNDNGPSEILTQRPPDPHTKTTRSSYKDHQILTQRPPDPEAFRWESCDHSVHYMGQFNSSSIKSGSEDWGGKFIQSRGLEVDRMLSYKVRRESPHHHSWCHTHNVTIQGDTQHAPYKVWWADVVPGECDFLFCLNSVVVTLTLWYVFHNSAMVVLWLLHQLYMITFTTTACSNPWFMFVSWVFCFFAMILIWIRNVQILRQMYACILPNFNIQKQALE